MVNSRLFLRRGVFDAPEPKRRRLDDTEDVEALVKQIKELRRENEKLHRQLSECFIRHSSGYLMNTRVKVQREWMISPAISTG